MRHSLLAFMLILAGGIGSVALWGRDNEAPNYDGPAKIALLLWEASPEKAAQTLAGLMTKAMERGHIEALSRALTPLEERVQAVVDRGAKTDPRWTSALAAAMLSGSTESWSSDEEERNASIKESILTGNGGDAVLLLQVWFLTAERAAFENLTTLLREIREPELASALIAAGLRANRRKTAELLLDNWERLPQSSQFVAVDPLTGSADSMRMLVKSIAVGKVSKDLVNTNQLRKWLQADREAWSPLFEPIWGKIRETADTGRQQVVQHTLETLQSAHGSASSGKEVFARVCAQCHILHGQGFEVGPNITNNGRGSLRQLVSNVLDPSLVIGDAFQARTLLTYDGSVLSGLVVAEDERYMTLKLQGGKTLELNKADDIEMLKTSEKSLMPEGVETQMTEQELLDLLAYLCLVKPLGAADNQLIPGTPVDFVQP